MSGRHPVCSRSDTIDYDAGMKEKFDDLIRPYGYSWKLEDIFPKVLAAGENAGYLTEEGAAFLDETGNLESGIMMCPPEGDAGTGMTATNSVAPRTGISRNQYICNNRSGKTA